MKSRPIEENTAKISKELLRLRKDLKGGRILIAKLKEHGVHVSSEAALTRIIKEETPIKSDMHALYLNAIEKIDAQYCDEYNKTLVERNEFERFYYQELKRCLKEKIDFQNPIAYFSCNYNLYEEDVTTYLSALPDIVFSHIHDKFKEKIPCRMVRYSSNDERLITTNNYKDFFEGNYCKYKIKDINSSVLGHALSPYSESLALLCELGRYRRIVSIFKIEKPYILLTDVDWAKLNYTVTELKNYTEIGDLDLNLEMCFDFRKKLYKRLGFNDENIDIKESYKVKSNNKKEFKTIEKESQAFEDYSLLIESILDEIVTKVEHETLNLPRLIRTLKDDTAKEKLKFLDLTIVDDMKNIYTISAVKKYFGRTDKNTFLYSLLQRYSLHDYDEVLKVGVESERKFDFAFAKMDAFEAGKVREMIGLYFPHYYYKKDFTVIPYTFPSGLLKEKTLNVHDIGINGATDNAILLFDYTSEGRSSKVKKLINDIDLIQLSKQMSDLLSFIYYYFGKENPDFWITGQYLFEENGFSDILESIRKFDENQIDKFQSHMFSLWFDAVDIPYFYYPYIISVKCIKQKDKLLESKYRDFSYKLIMHTIKQVCESLKVEEWK